MYHDRSIFGLAVSVECENDEAAAMPPNRSVPAGKSPTPGRHQHASGRPEKNFISKNKIATFQRRSTIGLCVAVGPGPTAWLLRLQMRRSSRCREFRAAGVETSQDRDLGRPCLIGQLWSRTEGKAVVRNLRGDDGNVGIIRSPVRSIVLP